MNIKMEVSNEKRLKYNGKNLKDALDSVITRLGQVKPITVGGEDFGFTEPSDENEYYALINDLDFLNNLKNQDGTNLGYILEFTLKEIKNNIRR